MRRRPAAPSFDRLVGQMDGAGQGGVGDVDDHRNAAALGGEGHQAGAVLQFEMDELAGGAHQHDAGKVRRSEKIDDFEHGADVDPVGSGAARGDGGGKDAGGLKVGCGWWGQIE